MQFICAVVIMQMLDMNSTPALWPRQAPRSTGNRSDPGPRYDLRFRKAIGGTSNPTYMDSSREERGTP